MVAAITLIGVLAMICFIICRRVYISYVILNFGCCPLNGLGKFRQNCPGYCQSLSAEMQYMQDGQGNYKKSHYNQPGRCNIAGVVLEENCCTEATEECGDSQTKEASLWQNLKEYFGFEHSASHDCSKDDITSMKIVNAPEVFNNAEENATLAEKTSNDVSVSGNTGYPGGLDQVIEEVRDPMSMSAVALKERQHSEYAMEVNNTDDSLTLTKETSNNVQVSGYPKDFSQRNDTDDSLILTNETSNNVQVSGYPKDFNRRIECGPFQDLQYQSDMEVNNMDDSLTLTKETSNKFKVSGYPKDFNQRNQITKKIKDPMNAVSLKERRRMVKELVLLDENPKPVYDYLVPIPIKEDVTLKEFESTESIGSLKKSKTLSSLKSDPVTLKERKLSSHESFALEQKVEEIGTESWYLDDRKSVESFQESYGQEIINAPEEKSSTQESIMELKERHNLFNAVGEKIVVNVRAVVTKE